ncbi:MAG: bifunctional demethylmenaquinone methyltransferase/2-methoxy-6-polyprenyl-1,4-benzoquinol methylase UbiE [Chitinophagales bacterium]
MKQTVTPYNSSEGKKKQVANMFNNVAGTYDFLNHFFSLGIDKLWRKKLVKLISREQPLLLLDVATGTGDLAIAESIIPNIQITGIDISEGMLEVGKTKVKQKQINNIQLKLGDSENLEFATDSFDAVSVAFGVRNFENLEKGLLEMQRVLKPGKKLFVLEFSKPSNFIFRSIYYLYFFYILPFVGRIVSKDSSAYSYLPESVKNFPSGKEFVEVLQKCNFKEIECKTLFFGISSIYIARK